MLLLEVPVREEEEATEGEERRWKRDTGAAVV